MSIHKGDIVLTKDHFIGVVRYIGTVENISKNDYDDYIGIEITFKQNPQSCGTSNGTPYFMTSNNNALFIKQDDIIRKFPPLELLQLIPNDIIKTNLFPKISNIPVIHETKTEQGDNNAPDLYRLQTQLSFSMNENEVTTLITFCENEGYNDLETVQCDIDEYDIKENSSIIVDHMKEEYDWNDTTQQQFVNNICNALKNADDPTNTSSPQTPQKLPSTKPAPSPPTPPPPPSDLPTIYDFRIPISLLKQRDSQNARDIIIACFKRNKIPNQHTEKLRKFFRANNIYTIDQLQNSDVLMTFISMNPELQIFETYINKCIYELSPPVFLPRKIEKKDELECKRILDEQCTGLIKHDKPLLHFILLTQFTSSELPSEIVDIADRIFIEEKRRLTKKEFGQKNFFKNIDDIKQKSTVSLGLTHYHHRFLPEFQHRPMKIVVDKISGYQKYCILLSHIIYNICNRANTQNNINVDYKDNQRYKPTSMGGTTIGCVPFLVDMMIIPPGCQDRVEDRKYDAKGPNVVGDIARKLKTFNITFEVTQGLKGKYNNFDEGSGIRIVKQIVNAIKKLTNNFNKSHQRICIVVDRRWRINCNEWIGYDKLKKSVDKNNLNQSWYKQNSDTIYVYAPNLKAKKTYHQFKENYIHETLLYLTKKCIIPKKNGQHIGGDTPDGWLFNISAHIETSCQPAFYKTNMRWYIFSQGAAIRFFPKDMVKLWTNYFAHCDEDKGRMQLEKINKEFKIDLTESDCSYKRWYCAIKRSD